ncbi:hypothetical protein quinque_013953 [Culex quinquefasciatus]
MLLDRFLLELHKPGATHHGHNICSPGNPPTDIQSAARPETCSAQHAASSDSASTNCYLLVTLPSWPGSSPPRNIPTRAIGRISPVTVRGLRCRMGDVEWYQRFNSFKDSAFGKHNVVHQDKIETVVVDVDTGVELSKPVQVKTID